MAIDVDANKIRSIKKIIIIISIDFGQKGKNYKNVIKYC